MSTLVIRLLVLANGLLLALPQGWCATLPTYRTAKPPPKVSCCCTCKQPSQSERSDPKPAPTQPFKICCCRADLTVPPTLEIGAPDLVLCAVLTATDNSGFRQGTAYADDLACLFLPPSLHVLNCVWRC